MLEASLNESTFCGHISEGIRLESIYGGAALRVCLINGGEERLRWGYITKCEELGFDKSGSRYGAYEFGIRKV